MTTASNSRNDDSVNDDSRERDEWRRLFAAQSDNTISAEDHQRLEQLLAQSEVARREWFLHCDLELGIADWAKLNGEESKAVISNRSPAFAPNGTTRGLRSPLRWVTLVVAASVIIAMGSFWLWPEREPMVQSVAVLSRAVDVEWVDSSEAKFAGAPLVAGPLRITAGALLVEFYSGARVIVEAPAEFDLVSASEAFLRSGRINAHVPPQAHGFVVRTENFEVTDLGTDFGLAIAVEGNVPKAEVHVFSGLVEVASTQSVGDVQSLKTGEALKVDEAAFVSIPSDRSAFLREEELTERENIVAQNRLIQLAETNRLLEADPSLVLHYSFDDEVMRGRTEPEQGQARQQAHEVIGQRIGCEWTTGRWPNKRALAFRHEGDRIRFTVPRPMEQVTLMAWVRIDSLEHSITSLLTADEERSGALRWELTSDGCLRLGIGRELNRNKLDWEAVNSDPVLLPDRYGQWLCVATTFDGALVQHFVNGVECGQGMSFRPPQLHIGTAEIGNWRGPSIRHFDGAIDDFVILSRPLGANEIRGYWQRGKP